MNDLLEINNQSLATQAKAGEQLVDRMPPIKKAFDLLDDDIVELSMENETLKYKIGSYDQQWFDECKLKLLRQIDDEKSGNLIMSRLKKQMEKH